MSIESAITFQFDSTGFASAAGLLALNVKSSAGFGETLKVMTGVSLR
ncbi:MULTISPECIES: hypothetical protein [Kosakonia]|nr:hypothetical protein [Kosakonia quasisacchari]